LRVDRSLFLDMSRSFDSNFGPNSLFNPHPLSFELRCFQISPLYRDSCPSLIFSSSSRSGVVVTPNSTSAVIGETFQIVMRGISSNSAEDLRRCEKFIRISILASLSPVVRLEVSSGSKMNPSSKLKILGSVDMGSSGELQWSVNDDSIVLSSVSLSPLSRSLPSSPINSPHVLSLVIVGNSLPPQSSFVFTLSCSLTNGYSSSSNFIITTNSPPFGGVLEVNPVKGVMLETVFTMLSLDWVDEDLPLSYQFGYFTFSPSLSISSSTGATVFRSKLQMPHTSTTLPSGSLRNQSSSNLTCVVVVFDDLDSSSSALFVVSVEEVKMSADDLRVFLLNGINTSQVNSNSDDLKSILSSTATVLNRVNCSSAPDCASLNRMECWSTEGTCGECVAGFVGLIGSSNTPCLSTRGGVHRSLLSTPSSLLSDTRSSGIACNSDAECGDGWFQECNFQLNLCQSIQQSCPNSCSGHGRCVFASKYDLNETVDECGLLDESCVSRCECEEGFMGSSCSLSKEEFLKQVDLRHLLIENVNDLMKMENVETSNVKSWMKTLSTLSSSDYLGLSKNSKISMSSLVIEILRVSVEVGLSIEDLKDSEMDRVVDICVSGLSSSFTQTHEEGGEALDSRFLLLMSLLKAYSDFVTADMSQDQYPVTSVNPFLRSSSFSLSSSSSSPLSLPQSNLESLGDFRQHSISLPTNISFPFSVSISETLIQKTSTTALSSMNSSRRLSPNATVATTQLSSPLFVSLSRSSCSTGDCVLKVMLQHKLNMKSSTNFSTENSSYFEADCVVGVVQDHEFLCPTGDNLVISCNGSVSGRGRAYCPTRVTVTQCEAKEISCLYSPSESNESMTTCLCNLTTLHSVGDGGGSVSFSLISIEKSVAKDFVSTWETSGSLSSGQVAGSWVVLVTVGGVGLSFVMMLLLGSLYDQQESRHVSKIEIETKQDHGSGEDARGMKSEHKLIEESLPSIFKADSLWLKFKEEMRVYHRWLGIVFYYSPEFPRSMRVLSLFSSIVIMLFIQSVTYNIADPDDGSCENCDTEHRCLSLKSTLNGKEDRCYWQSSEGLATNVTISEGSCHFRDIGKDMTRILIVAMTSAVVSAPLALSIQYLIRTVLSKQCVSDEEVQKEKQRYQSRRSEKLRKTQQIVGVLPSLSVENRGETLLEELNSLLKELSSHYTALVMMKRKGEAKEFQGQPVTPSLLPTFDKNLLTPFPLIRCLGISRGGQIICRPIEARSSLRWFVSILLEVSFASSRSDKRFVEGARESEERRAPRISTIGRIEWQQHGEGLGDKDDEEETAVFVREGSVQRSERRGPVE
jgi:hypothetical protein